MRSCTIGLRDASPSSVRLLVIALLAFVAIASPAFAVEKASEQVSAFYGSFSHSIPIEVPSFRGLEPRIALGYSSEGRNGLVGVGWSLSGFSTIQRVNAGLGSPRFDTNDIYVLDGQELVKCVAGSVSPSCTSGGNWSTKVESYLKIKQETNNTWTVWSKDGTRTIYNQTIAVPANALVPGGTLRWGVSKRIDTDGNEVDYSWTCVPADYECHPSQTTYNGYNVTFFHEARPDHLSWAGASVLGRTSSRLRSIIVWAPAYGHIRGYKLGYQTSPLTERSLLSSLQQYGKDLAHTDGLITGGTSLPAQTFTYQNDTIGFVDWGAPPTPPTASEPVTWANLVNAGTAGDGSSLVKGAGGSNWDAGADSSRAIASGNGYVQWQASDPIIGGKAAGLSNGNTDASLADIDYAFVENGSGLHAYEKGVLKGTYTRAHGDQLRIEVSGGIVYFKKNGVTLRQSVQVPLFPLRVDTSIHGVNDVIQSVSISGQLTYVNAWCQAILMTGDFNGDGRTDQLCYSTTGGVGRSHVALATSDGFASPSLWLSGFPLTRSTIADFNNDGKADLASHDSTNGDFRVALSNGASAFQAPVLWGNATGTLPGGATAACVGTQAVVGAGDFNGDGLTDAFCKRPNFESNYQFVGLARFLNGAWSFDFSTVFGNYSCDDGEAQVGAMDFDGDGKDDWYCIGAENEMLQVYVSTGTSFIFPAHGGLSFCTSNGYVMGDFNADGRTDVACRTNGKVALSMGRSFMEQGAYGAWCLGDHAQAFGADVDGDGAAEIVCNNQGSAATDIQVRRWVGAGQASPLATAETWRANWCSGKVSAGDWNGDGKTDLYCTSTTEPAVAGTSGLRVDLASTFANGLGGTIALAYTPSSAFPNENNPSTKHTITSLTIGDGRGWVATNTFTYSGGLMDYQERVFLGYRYVKKTLPCLTGESSCPYIETWLKQDLASAGAPEAVIRRHGGGNVLNKQTFSYTTNGATIPRTSLLTGETTYFYDGVGCPSSPCSQEKQTTVTHQYDAYGNRTQSAFGGDPADPQDDRTTNWLYAYNPSTYIVDRPSEEGRLDHTGATAAATRYRYDGGGWNAAPSEGHVTHTDRLLKGQPDRWVTTTTAYSPAGNVTSVTDPTNRVTTTTYDPTHNIYPQTVMNPALPGEATTTTWDARCSLPSQLVDENGQTTTYLSDALCRRTRTNMPMSGFSEIFYRDFGNPNMQRVVVETPPAVTGGTNQFAARHFDGLSRDFMTVDKGPSPTKMIYTATTFNPRGGVETETAPYYLGDPTYITTRSYDAMDRLTQVRHPDNETIDTSYGLWSVTTTDQNGRSKTTRFDAYDRAIVEERLLGGQPVQTISTYDSLDRLIGLQGPLEATWSWQFDTLGRNVSKSDPDAGTWTYLFDDADRMTHETDAKQQRTQFRYDPAGRVATKTTYTTGATPEATVTMTYSQARSGYYNTAKLTTISGPGTTVLEKDYDARGRLTRERRALDGVVYGMQTLYGASDRPVSKQFPDLDTYVITYDEAGRPKALSSVLNDALWDASGRLTEQTNVNNTVTQRTYTPTRGFLTSILTTTTASVIQDLQYTPDPTGRLSSVTSSYTNESWNYDYDDMYRLSGASAVPPSAHTQNWTYDEAGRILTNSRVGSYSYVGSSHGPKSAGGNTYSRDLNGNVLSGAGRTYTWNAANRLTQVNSTQFVYDDAGERLKKTTGSDVSRYPFGDDYEITNGVTTKYFSLPGMGVIGKRVTGAGNSIACDPTMARDGFYWTHTDHLGSIQAVTDAQGCEVKRRKFRAYGETLDETVPQHVESRGWIDQRLDTETGLTYLHARSYDSLLGLFVSPDPTHPTVPGVGLNRFIYGLGNPLFGTDRSGLTFSYSCGGPHAGAIDDCLTFGMRAGPSVMYNPATGRTEIYDRREGAPRGNSAQGENDRRYGHYGPPPPTPPRQVSNSQPGQPDMSLPETSQTRWARPESLRHPALDRHPRTPPKRGVVTPSGYTQTPRQPRKGHRPNPEDKQAQQHEPQ
jgi:RHS repeat-associated protein